MDASRCDYVFAHVGDGRRWFIPAPALGGGTSITLGGPKYADFEVQPGEPLQGDAGEASFVAWVLEAGGYVFAPVAHTPSDFEFVADFGAKPLRVQVKTSTCRHKARYVVAAAQSGLTLGGPKYA